MSGTSDRGTIEDPAANLHAGEARRRVLRTGNTAIALPIIVCLAGAVAIASRNDSLAVAAIILCPLGGIGALVLGVMAIARARKLGAAMATRSETEIEARLGVSGLWIAAVSIVGVLGGLVMSGIGFVFSLLALGVFGRGRQIRSFGRLLLPPVVAGNDWNQTVRVDLDICADLDAPTRAAMAAQWRENGRTEHASVAAFAALTSDLMALGAPPALLVAAQQDALDEIRHAEICFAIARALDGKEESPGAFAAARRNRVASPSRTLALATLAVDSLIDGAVHEGMSARMLARVTKRCEDRTIQAFVKEITADEGRHSTHGWDVVRWCLERGGEPVLHAVRGAVAALPETSASPAPAPAKDGSWERYGLPGDRLHDEEYARTIADVRKKVLRWSGASTQKSAA